MRTNSTAAVPLRDCQAPLPVGFVILMMHTTSRDHLFTAVHSAHKLENLHGRRTRQDNKNGGEDAKQGWKNDFDRCFLGHFLSAQDSQRPQSLGMGTQGTYQAGSVVLGLDDHGG